MFAHQNFGVLPLDKVAHLNGMEVFTRMIAGEHFHAPPICKSMGFILTEAEPGRVVFSGEATADFYNPMGSIHGGWMAAVLDSAMACAVHTLLTPGELYTTASMNLTYVRPLSANAGIVRCEGTIINKGNRMATSEGKLIDSKGRLIAHGTETCFIFENPALQKKQ